MIDRKIGPEIREVQNLTLPEPYHYTLDNGIPVYEINMGTQEVLKLEIIFKAGRPHEQKKLAARATAALLKEGTASFSSAVIAETVDFYGGTLNVPVNLDTSNIILYSLNKYVEQLLPIVAEMITVPVFPEKELDSFKQRNLQRLQVDLTKNDVVAYRKITEYIYGEHQAYGYNSFPKHYNALEVADLKRHFDRNYVMNNCTLIVSGKINKDISRLLNQYIGSIQRFKPLQHQPLSFRTVPPQKVKIEHPDTVQTAIRIGQRLFDRKHEDYQGINFLNTVLGGYFGSRLMTNIREDKGYTYNIYSSVDSMIADSYFYVATEVGNEFVKPTLAEIYKEFEKLKKEPIEKEELEMVQNYMLGNLLTMLDGAFNVSEIVKTMVMEELPQDYFQSLVQTIKNMDEERVQALAQQYLNEEDLWEVIVGV